MVGILPETIVIHDKEYKIRTDYRNILQSFEVFSDADLDNYSKWIVVIHLLFYEFKTIDEVEKAIDNGLDLQEVIKQIGLFITSGDNIQFKEDKPLFDWAQDEQIIFSAINKVAGKEVRTVEYMHWWTFYGYFNEIGEGTFQTVVGIRNKLNKHKKLEPYETDFYNLKKESIILKKKLSVEEQEAEDKYQALLNKVL